jgi:hypothetical protein
VFLPVGMNSPSVSTSCARKDCVSIQVDRAENDKQPVGGRTRMVRSVAVVFGGGAGR